MEWGPEETITQKFLVLSSGSSQELTMPSSQVALDDPQRNFATTEVLGDCYQQAVDRQGSGHRMVSTNYQAQMSTEPKRNNSSLARGGLEIALSLQLTFQKHMDSKEVSLEGSMGQFTPGNTISIESVTEKTQVSKRPGAKEEAYDSHVWLSLGKPGGFTTNMNITKGSKAVTCSDRVP